MKKLMIVLVLFLVGCTSKEDIAKDYIHDLFDTSMYSYEECSDGDFECVLANREAVFSRVEEYHSRESFNLTMYRLIVNSLILNEDIEIIDESYILEKGVGGIDQVAYEIYLRLGTEELILRGHILFDDKGITGNYLMS